MVQEDCVKPKIIVITGPTAVGKSDFAIDLALKINGEIISADSMQIFKGMDIGTGKVTKEETRGVIHHLIDVCEPFEEFSAGEYVKRATIVINEICAKNKIPIIVGGTGFYINGLLNGYNFSSSSKNEEARNKWFAIAKEKGNEYVHNYLASIDPISANQINSNDIKRTVRAIEIFESTGKPRGEVSTQNENSYNSITIVITDDRQVLYERINKRVDKMFEKGLEAEVKQFLEYKDCQSMQAIGYKEFIPYFERTTTIEEVKELIKKNSRNYAKRQMTFFRWIKTENKHFINLSEKDKIFEIINDFLLK